MKKLFVMLLSGALIVTSVPVNGLAASKVTTETTVAESTGNKTAEPSDEALKSVILAVKQKIEIPEDYSKFNYNFNDSNSYKEAYWNLTWTDADSNKGIVVKCDTDNHITYFNKYDYNQDVSGLAKYLKSELQPKAEAFLAKIAPETAGYLKLTDSGYYSTYRGDYYYAYERVKNGVDFPDNSITVSVNSITGEVTSASISWLYDTSIPSAKATVTKEAAADLIKKNMKMKLVYRSNSNIIYSSKAADASIDTTQAYLVYEPSQDYISVDANTGEVYQSRIQWVDSVERDGSALSMGTAAKSDSTADTSNVSLSQDELSKIEDLKNLISKSKAIKLVTENKSLYLDKNMTKFSATLGKNDNNNGNASYVWNVQLEDPREVTNTDSYRAIAWASVDAETGKIISYSASLKSNYDDVKQIWSSVKIKYNKEESKAILEKFIKTQTPDYFSSTVLSDETNDYVAYYNKKEQAVYGGYSFLYNRVNEGIEFEDNNINGSVDGVTGKVYSFGFNWDNKVTFQSSKGVITADQAMDYYMANKGYGLKYEVNQINTNANEKSSMYSANYKIRLVYRPDITPAYISPFTGEQMNANGEIYKETKPYTYKDIEATEANRDILLLSDMNIGFEGENFQPEKYITLEEIKTLMKDIGYTTADGDDKKLVTREELAGFFIDSLGIKKLSKLKIYSTGYIDESKIDSDYIGAVAIAKGLGIMTEDSNNNFNPTKNVTRYEAVTILINYIAAMNSSVYN